jgi:hypothetical protein
VLVLASHEGGSNALFPLALLVPFVVGVVLWLCLAPIRNRSPRSQPLLLAMVAAVMGLSLHVSVITWRHHKDVAMCRSWDSPERLDRCIAERRERAHGPWGIFLVRNGGD